MVNFKQMNDRFTSRYYNKLNRLCKPLFQAFGINSFFYQSVSRTGCFFSIGTSADLMDFYFCESDSFKNNPFINRFDSLKSGIYFQEAVKNELYQESERVLQRKFGIQYFCLMAEKGEDWCDQFGFGRHPNNKIIEHVVINEMPLIHRFIHYFRDEMRQVITALREDPVQLDGLPRSRGDLGLPKTKMEYSRRFQFLKKIGLQYEPSTQALTRREKLCVAQFLKGKSARQIAETFGLSTRTVEHCLENIKEKLFCSTKSELFQLLQTYASLELLPIASTAE